MIYFIECSGRIKVGFSLNPWARMSKVSADSPFPCTLIGVMLGDRKKEAQIHVKWWHLHRHGEWFNATEDFRAWIGENATERQQLQPEKIKGALCGLPIGHGDKRRIAKACGVSAPAVTQWRKVPAEYCSVISRITGLALQELRPDIFTDRAIAIEAFTGISRKELRPDVFAVVEPKRRKVSVAKAEDAA